MFFCFLFRMTPISPLRKIRLFGSSPNHCLWRTQQLRQVQCPFPCSLFLFPFVVHLLFFIISSCCSSSLVVRLFGSSPNHCLWRTQQLRQVQCPFPCSLFLFPLVVHHLLFITFKLFESFGRQNFFNRFSFLCKWFGSFTVDVGT